jgi:hypothetical protein
VNTGGLVRVAVYICGGGEVAVAETEVAGSFEGEEVGEVGFVPGVEEAFGDVFASDLVLLVGVLGLVGRLRTPEPTKRMPGMPAYFNPMSFVDMLLWLSRSVFESRYQVSWGTSRLDIVFVEVGYDKAILM